MTNIYHLVLLLMTLFNDAYSAPSTGDLVLAKTDDGSYSPAKIGVNITFFNKKYSKIFVNANGHITFLASYSSYIPIKFPISTPLIALFWSDINVKIGGNIYYRESSSVSDIENAKSDIIKAYPEFSTFTPKRAYVITWDEVAAYGHTKLVNNTMKITIAVDENFSFLIYQYGKLAWPNSSFKVSVEAGHNAGDLKNFFMFSSSFSSDFSKLSIDSNINVPGKWVFRVDQPFVLTTTTTTTTTTTKTITNAPISTAIPLIKTDGINDPAFVFSTHTDQITQLISLPEDQLASSSLDGTVKIWNLKNGTLIADLRGHSLGVLVMANISNASLLASAGLDRIIKVWNYTTRSLLFSLTGHQNTITTLVVLSVDRLVSGSLDSTIRI